MAANPVISSVATHARDERRWVRWKQDPFVHFLAIGLALLALYTLVAPPRERAADHRIELSLDDVRQMQIAWMAKWKRPPTSAEMQGLVEQKVREEVLYREALAMGLDQDDTIVKRRLAQKLEFLTEDIAAIRDPTAAELEVWFRSNAARFATPSRVTFRHIYFSPDKRGERAAVDAKSTLERLSQTHATAETSRYGDTFPDRDYYAERTPDQLAAQFGSQFPKALKGLPPGTWHGPIESGLGWHLVWIDASTAGHVPTFAEADREDVKSAWIDVQRAESKRKAYETMRSRYEVLLPGTNTQ